MSDEVACTYLASTKSASRSRSAPILSAVELPSAINPNLQTPVWDLVKLLDFAINFISGFWQVLPTATLLELLLLFRRGLISYLSLAFDPSQDALTRPCRSILAYAFYEYIH